MGFTVGKTDGWTDGFGRPTNEGREQDHGTRREQDYGTDKVTTCKDEGHRDQALA